MRTSPNAQGPSDGISTGDKWLKRMISSCVLWIYSHTFLKQNLFSSIYRSSCWWASASDELYKETDRDIDGLWGNIEMWFISHLIVVNGCIGFSEDSIVSHGNNHMIFFSEHWERACWSKNLWEVQWWCYNVQHNS